jgi:hypothetical protein
MKKFLLSALSVFAISASTNAQVNKMPLIEHFTSASCPPCVTQNIAMKAILDNMDANNLDYVKIAHQGNYSFDPMENSFPTGPSVRFQHYGGTGVPHSALNGTSGYPSAIVTASTMAAVAAQTTPYDVKVSQTWNTATSIDVKVVVHNTTGAAVSTANKIFVSMVENEVIFATAPGSNGETNFHYVLRQMYNATSGAANATAGSSLAAIPANDSIVFNMTITPPSYIADLNQVSFAAYIQASSGNAMEQAGKSQAGGVPGLLNVAATANSTVGAGYCNYNFTPSINFINNGTIPVTTVTGEYTINGGTAVPVTVGGLNLAIGQSTAIAFPATTLPSTGASTVEYTITDVNAGGSYSGGPVAMASEIYSKLPSASSATPLTQGFQGLAIATASPSGVIADNPNEIRAYSVTQGISPDVTWNLGGHGTSDGCFRWDYFAVNNGQSSKLVWEKLDLTTSVNTRLSFARAHALYGGTEPDRLKVNVSIDCGTTWTTVWDKQGSQLATTPPVGNNVRFYPAVTQWVTDTIDLTAYDGATELVIAFEGISGYGNSLYLDDVNTFQGTSVGVSTINAETAEVSIWPNPVSTRMTLEFTMLNTAEASISIVNALGQQVQQVTNGSFSGTNVVEVNTSNLVSGVYFVNITTKLGTTTTRFVRQ